MCLSRFPSRRSSRFSSLSRRCCHVFIHLDMDDRVQTSIQSVARWSNVSCWVCLVFAFYHFNLCLCLCSDSDAFDETFASDGLHHARTSESQYSCNMPEASYLVYIPNCMLDHQQISPGRGGPSTLVRPSDAPFAANSRVARWSNQLINASCCFSVSFSSRCMCCSI